MPDSSSSEELALRAASAHGSSSSCSSSDSKSSSSSGSETDGDAVATVVALTSYSRREVKEFFRDGDRMTPKRFRRLMTDHGFHAQPLRTRLWETYDVDHDGTVSTAEILVHLHALTRGELKDLTAFFFHLFDVNGDQEVSTDELVSVYRELLKETTGTIMTDDQIRRAAEFVEEADADGNGVLSYEEYHAAVERAVRAEQEKDEAERIEREKGPAFVLSSIFLFILVTLLEAGTSWSFTVPSAISLRLQRAFAIGVADIGLLSGVYYAPAIIFSIAGGMAMDRFGPGMTTLVSTLLVLLGSVVQAVAGVLVESGLDDFLDQQRRQNSTGVPASPPSVSSGPSPSPPPSSEPPREIFRDAFNVLLVGRVIVAAGGAILPYSSLELVRRFFPRRFMAMAAWRNCLYFFNLAAAIFFLPSLSDRLGRCDTGTPPPPSPSNATALGGSNTSSPSLAPPPPPPPPSSSPDFTDPQCLRDDVQGTTRALFVVTVIAGASALASILALIYSAAASNSMRSRTPTPGTSLRALAEALAPKPPSALRHIALPGSFYLAIYGIRSAFFATFSLTPFTVALFVERGVAPEIASLATAVVFIMGGILSPVSGPLSDRIGRRGETLGAAVALAAVGSLVLLSPDTWAMVVGIGLLGLSTGWTNVVAIPCVPLLVGHQRAGQGYGMLGALGSVLAFLAPFAAGNILAVSEVGFFVFFASILALGAASWFIIAAIEGRRAFIALPDKDIPRLSPATVDAAVLFTALGVGEEDAARRVYNHRKVRKD